MGEWLLSVYWVKPLLNISGEIGVSGIESEQKPAAQILAIFVFSHRSAQVSCSWGTAEKWTVIAGSSHCWGTSHHFQWLHCQSSHKSHIKKKKKVLEHLFPWCIPPSSQQWIQITKIFGKSMLFFQITCGPHYRGCVTSHSNLLMYFFSSKGSDRSGN